MKIRTWYAALTFALWISSASHAATPYYRENIPTEPESVKPAAIIYFNDNSAIGIERAGMIHEAVKETETHFHIALYEHALASEAELEEHLEKIADDGIGLIILIEPQNMETVSKLPGLYPDINFSIIGGNAPLYFTNVRSMLFKDQEGVFLMGVLAGMRSKTEAISIISKEDNEDMRNLAYAFSQGAQYANNNIHVSQQLGNKIYNANNLPQLDTKIPAPNSDIKFILEEELLDTALKNAQAQKQYIITYNHNLTNAYPNIVITSLLKHYDIAIYHTLRGYTRNEWKPGTQWLGIENGFLDYVLNQSNKALIPKEAIEKLEASKDLIAQNRIHINALH